MAAFLRRVGIFGGTFDPVHNGHVEALDHFVREIELDRVLIVPGRSSNYKKRACADFDDRLQMCRLAFASMDRVEVSDLERDAPNGLFTCELIDRVRSLHPRAKLFFLLGSDALQRVPDWYGAASLAGKVQFVVIERMPEVVYRAKTGLFETDSVSVAFNRLMRMGIEVSRVTASGIAMSSTTVRKMAASGNAIDPIVPSKVARYIKDNCLYVNSYKRIEPGLRMTGQHEALRFGELRVCRA